LREREQVEDQHQASEQEQPVARDFAPENVRADPRLDEVREKALGRDQTSEDGPGDHRDPADVSERDESERGQDPEAGRVHGAEVVGDPLRGPDRARDRKSTRLNSSHVAISYAVFCLKKKKNKHKKPTVHNTQTTMVA